MTMRSFWALSLFLVACAPSAKPAPTVPPAATVAPPAQETDPAPPPQLEAPEALGLVIDRSGSMTGEPIEATIAACQASIELLDADDLVTVIVFDSRADVFIPLQPKGDGRALRARLAQLTPGGGTEYIDALTAVGAQLRGAAPEVRRRVLFLSDGQAATGGVVELVTKLHQQGITLSTMSLGRNVDAELLDEMAEAGGGRHHREVEVAELSQAFDVEIRHLMGLP